MNKTSFLFSSVIVFLVVFIFLATYDEPPSSTSAQTTIISPPLPLKIQKETLVEQPTVLPEREEVVEKSSQNSAEKGEIEKLVEENDLLKDKIVKLEARLNQQSADQLKERYAKMATSVGISPSYQFLIWLEDLRRRAGREGVGELVDRLSFEQLDALRISFEKTQPKVRQAWDTYQTACVNSKVLGAFVRTNDYEQTRRSWELAKEEQDESLRSLLPNGLVVCLP